MADGYAEPGAGTERSRMAEAVERGREIAEAVGRPVFDSPDDPGDRRVVERERDYWAMRARRSEGALRQVSYLVAAVGKRTRKLEDELRNWREREANTAPPPDTSGGWAANAEYLRGREDAQKEEIAAALADGSEQQIYAEMARKILEDREKRGYEAGLEQAEGYWSVRARVAERLLADISVAYAVGDNGAVETALLAWRRKEQADE